MRQIKKIVLHHSLTQDGKTVSWNAIRRYHVDERGWSDIGYHFGIELIDNGYEILCGRMLDVAGAHTRGENQDSIGICFVGNYDYAFPPLDMLQRGVLLVRSLLKVFNLTPDDVYGHRNFAPDRTCPGKRFDLDKFRNLLRIE